MPTIINNPPGQTSSEDGMGLGVILGIIFAVVIAGILFFVYGLPAIRGAPSGTNINVQLPANPPATPTPTP